MTTSPHQLLELLTDYFRKFGRGKITTITEQHISQLFLQLLQTNPNRVIFQIAPSEDFAMARFTQSTFASITLGKDDEKRFQEWLKSESISALVAAERLLSDGFKFSCSWVTGQGAFCFSIIGTDETAKHKGLVMTTWSDDLEEVICLGAYKHYAVCGGDTWPVQADGPRWG